MKPTIFYRYLFYMGGLLILALGLTLNTKAGLGVSPIISVPYSLSLIFGFNFGNMTLVFYCVFVLIQIFIHIVQCRQSASHEEKNKAFFTFIMILLQIPLSIIFTRFLNIFSMLLPEFSYQTQTISGYMLRAAVLILAILCTGIGAAMSLSMRLVPNPGDGIVQAIADCIHKTVGFTKNCFDLLNISITISIGLLLAGKLTGIGIGTVIAVFGVGRTIALFQHFTLYKMNELAGLETVR